MVVCNILKTSVLILGLAQLSALAQEPFPVRGKVSKGAIPALPVNQQLQRTTSGLQYSVRTAGQGKRLAVYGDIVTFHYSLWLQDGTLVESTHEEGRQPVRTVLGVQMLPAWVESLQLMQQGSVFALVVPPKLAFAEHGLRMPEPRPSIPAHATLIYQLELLQIQKGYKLPRYPLEDPSHQHRTDSGLQIQILQPGKGAKAKSGQLVEVGFALWSERGNLLSCSELPEFDPFRGILGEDMADGPAFLNEAIAMLQPGGRYRFKVPAKLGYGDLDQGYFLPANSVTHWQLSLLSVRDAPESLAVPEFQRLPLAKTQRTPSGLRYHFLTRTDGALPGSKDTVTFHFAGWLANGKLVGESYSSGTPHSRPLTEMILGWQEALQFMPVGSVLRLQVPPKLAFGLRGHAASGIGPQATLIYQLELLSSKAAIQTAESPPPASKQKKAQR